MSEEHTIDYVLTINTELAYADIRKLEITLIRLGNILRRITGSEEFDQILANIQRIIMIIRTAETAIRAFQMASGPIGWLYAGVGAVTGAISIGTMASDLMYDYTRIRGS